MEVGMDLSAEAFGSLTKRLKKHTRRWLKAERHAQSKRSTDCTVMDIYDTVTVKGMYHIQCIIDALLMCIEAPSLAEIQQKLIAEEAGDSGSRGETSWIASGMKIQELQ